MAQNQSTAVMARRVEPADSLDDFPTPLWATRALPEHVPGAGLAGRNVWDPACGRGTMVRPLAEYSWAAVGSDVRDYGFGFARHDFLQPYLPDGLFFDAVVTNPPFRLAEQFARRAFAVTTFVALLVRTQFLEGVGRHRLFCEYPPMVVAQFAERAPMVKGRLDRAASTATAYCWIFWRLDEPGGSSEAVETRMVWIPPCRAKLERPDDWAGWGGGPSCAS